MIRSSAVLSDCSIGGDGSHVRGGRISSSASIVVYRDEIALP